MNLIVYFKCVAVWFCKLSWEGCQFKMTLTMDMLLAKCVHSMQRVPFPRSFLFHEMLRWSQKCKIKSLADGFKLIKFKDEHFLFSCVQYESCNTYTCCTTFWCNYWQMSLLGQLQISVLPVHFRFIFPPTVAVKISQWHYFWFHPRMSPFCVCDVSSKRLIRL